MRWRTRHSRMIARGAARTCEASCIAIVLGVLPRSRERGAGSGGSEFCNVETGFAASISAPEEGGEILVGPDRTSLQSSCGGGGERFAVDMDRQPRGI